MQTFEDYGFAPLEEEYFRAWLHSGQQVEAHDLVAVPSFAATEAAPAHSSAASEQPATSLTIIGLSKQGFLLAEDKWGRRFELTPDGNSLDMMRGLIKRKEG